MVQEFALQAELVVEQIVGLKTCRLNVLVGDQTEETTASSTPWVRRRWHQYWSAVRKCLAHRRRRDIETARTETLRPGVVGHDIRGNVPGQAGAATEAAFALGPVEGVAARLCGSASAVGVIEDEWASAGGEPHRALLEFIVVVSAGAS